jgi:O-Antigen ligase
MRDRVLDLSVPNPTPALFLLALVTAVLLASDGLSWAGFLLLGVMLVPYGIYLFSRNLNLALAALIVGSALPRVFFEMGSMKARPEHLVAGMLCVAAIFIYKRRHEHSVWIFGDILLLIYVALNIFSSVFRSVEPAQTFKWSLQQLLVIAGYFLVRLLAGSVERFQLGVNIMLVVGMIEGLYAAICFYSNLLFKTEFGLDPGQYDNAPAVYGTQFEANLLGSYCAACLVMMIVMYFHKTERKYLWGIGLTYLGFLVSFSRAAMLAAVVALVVLAAYARLSRAATRATLFRVAVVLVLVTVVVGVTLVPLYAQRFSTLDTSDPAADDNTRVRLLTLGVALEHILENPVFGSGTSSFQVMFDFKEIGYFEEQSSGWISNTEMRVLHDTGVLGLAALLWFVLYLMVRGIKVARRTRSPELVGLLLSSVVYLVSFQATDGTLLAFCWVHLGMIAVAIAVYAEADAEAKIAAVAQV